MSLPAARLADMSTSDPCKAPPRPNVQGSGNVFMDGMPAHIMTNAWAPHACPASPPHGAATVQGSGSVFINGLPAARLSGKISCGSIVAQGSGSVFCG